MIRSQGGTLHALAGLLVLSAIVRLSVAGPAMAEETQQADPAAVAASASGEGVAALNAAFQQREARVKEREDAIAARMRALLLAEQEAAERLAQLVAAEEALSATIAQVDVAAETDVDRLVAVYEGMKPKQAADLFSQMSPDFAAGFLGLMSAEAAAQIMTLVPPEHAYSISVVLAGRNANAPDG
ncbi:hypothetical protein AN189_00605 [Loktanella sp. 3ANDIMAR09]|uniref:MotE family protein n=1 Tax=Loktanella sp. 3ANDIMAR09 TaxID=1225657 RepID=UPI0006F5E7D6|nr:hypothetical protein [Loktanella sp. 3ANDIMAR09]KQI69949.1 hypothetical protein AN189_00605 [Loktanella sp. 3ANDIMAR09]